MKWLDRIFAVALSFAVFAMIIIALDYSENRRITSDAREKFHSQETFASSSSNNVENEDGLEIANALAKTTGSSESVLKKSALDAAEREKFNKMTSINPDYAGWLSIEGTAIDYPIVKSKDNKFYLSHGFDMEPNLSGSIFMDYRNKGNGKDKNIVIYGHNMKNGTMFKGLMDFKRKEFFEENKRIVLNDGIEESFWEIFSVYVTDTGFNYIRTEFTDMQYIFFVREISEKSMHEVDDNLENIDAVLTLSTCSYEFDDARFVVHARKIEEGEKVES